jgi:hypothetical protein
MQREAPPVGVAGEFDEQLLLPADVQTEGHVGHPENSG